MSKTNHKKGSSEQDYNAPKGGWLKAIIDAFILNLFRICKSALYLEIDSIGHFILDLICLSLPLTIMFFLKWWYGYYIIFGLIGMCLTAGISVKLGQNAKDKKRIHLIMTQDKTYEPLENDTPDVSPDNELDMPPKLTPDNTHINNIETRTLSNKEIPDYPLDDWDSWSVWLKENSDRFRIASR